MTFEKYLANKKALVITLDDTLFPKKDYLLQVYYLFSEFLAYVEHLDSKRILAFMTETYTAEGEDSIFQKTAIKFQIPEKYEQNFNLLHETARLPLKLLLFKNVLTLLQEAVENDLQLFLLADGNPTVTLNKIKQTEWHGLEAYLKAYFTVEYDSSVEKTLEHLLEGEGFKYDEVVLFTSQIQSESNFVDDTIDSFSVTEIL